MGESKSLDVPPSYLSPLPESFRPKKAATIFDDKKRKALLQKLEKDLEKEREHREKELEKEREAEAKRERKEKKKAEKEVVDQDFDDKLSKLYAQLNELVVKPDLALMESICLACEHADVDSQVKIFRKVLHAAGGDLMVRFLEKAIKNEVAATTMQTTLFRSNNFAIVMLAAHSRVVAIGYLKSLLTPLLEWVLSTNYDYELNPVKITSSGEDGKPAEDPAAIVEQNKARVKEALDKFFGAILASLDQLPLGMKQMCVALRKEVEVKFPSAVPFTMGGYYFLRLVCPSIVSPEGFGILDREIDQKARRPLILISKILQNLANETSFKEEYMQVMNEWMATATPKMNEFLLKLSQGDVSHEPTTYAGDHSISNDEYKAMAAFITKTLPKIQKRFAENPALISSVGYPLMQNLENVLGEINKLEEEIAQMNADSLDKKAKKKKDKELAREETMSRDRDSRGRRDTDPTVGEAPFKRKATGDQPSAEAPFAKK